jgi:predicted dithiol-disulfide oxidoreductase (DUF899 family)
LSSPEVRPTEENAMPEHTVGTQEEWQAERNKLLAEEKELTRRSDELARKRRELPWVPIEKEYRFDTDEGTRTLAELFDGRSQLLVYHVMFGTSFEAACPVCSSMADGFNGVLPYLHARDVTTLLTSRAPLERLQAYKRRMGWSIPWASTVGNDFNFDFGVSYTPEQAREQFGPALDDPTPGLRQLATASGTDVLGYVAEGAIPTSRTFVLDDGVVYHAYSTQGRGVEFLMGYYPILDRVPKGRDEGDAPAPDSMFWIRRHDEYEDAGAGGTS